MINLELFVTLEERFLNLEEVKDSNHWLDIILYLQCLEVLLNYTSFGHYCVPTDRGEILVGHVCPVRLQNLDKKERYKTSLKLHRQFAHPGRMKLISLLKDADTWDESFENDLALIYQNCELYKVYARTPARPSAALPTTTRFNEKVAMDLKKWSKHWILHLVDMWSRLTVSVFGV